MKYHIVGSHNTPEANDKLPATKPPLTISEWTHAIRESLMNEDRVLFVESSKVSHDSGRAGARQISELVVRISVVLEAFEKTGESYNFSALKTVFDSIAAERNACNP